jgi:hypothetical protein
MLHLLIHLKATELFPLDDGERGIQGVKISNLDILRILGGSAQVDSGNVMHSIKRLRYITSWLPHQTYLRICIPDHDPEIR